jgi:dihydroflavonol-4-reductase
VRDVVNIMISLMNSDISGEKYLLNSESVYFKNSFAMMSEALELKTKWKEAKPWMMQLAWRFEKIKSLITFTSPRITKEIVSMGSHLSFYSNEKIKKALKWEFIPVTESVAFMAKFFKG